jgi:YbbR domain-containing protein
VANNDSSLRERIFGNLGLKLLSLAIAVALYLTIANQPVTEVGLVIPLEYRNLPPGLEITSEQLAQVHVRVRGPADLVDRVSRTDITAYLDLHNATAGVHTFDLDRSGSVHAPYGLGVVDVWPAQVQLDLEKKISRELPVQVRLSGHVADAYMVAAVHVFPQKLLVVGPASRVEKMNTLLTDPIDLSGLTRTTTLVTQVYVTDPLARIAGESIAHVTIVVAPRSPK